MTSYRKRDFPVAGSRQHLEAGPVVLVTSAWKGDTDIMTMGWHMMLEFTPALFGCVISEGNHSFELVRRSRECVVNIPTIDLIDQVVAIGNTSGEDVVARVAASPRDPRTIHYRGEGRFMVAGRTISRRAGFRIENL